jgi:hypothetical protein
MHSNCAQQSPYADPVRTAQHGNTVDCDSRSAITQVRCHKVLEGWPSHLVCVRILSTLSRNNSTPTRALLCSLFAFILTSHSPFFPLPPPPSQPIPPGRRFQLVITSTCHRHYHSTMSFTDVSKATHDAYYPLPSPSIPSTRFLTFVRVNYSATAGLTRSLSRGPRPIPQPLVAAIAVIPHSAGQVDLPLCVIRFHRRVPTQSKHSHAWPPLHDGTAQFPYGAIFSQKTLVIFPQS